MARLIFDLDGTLVHSLPALCRAGNVLLAELGRAPVDEATYMGFVGRGMEAQVRDLLIHSGGIPEAGFARCLQAFLTAYERDPISGCTPYPGVVDALAVLETSHKLGVSTQKHETAARYLLEEMGLLRFFGAITGGDTLNVLKPDPAMLFHSAEALGQGQILFIGDSEVDRATASNAEVPFLLHENGYRKTSIEAIAPDAHFNHYDHLPGLVSSFMKTFA